MQGRPTWKQLLGGGEPLLLPCAHDALSARLIERAGFRAYSIGGYALVGARHALPDIGLVAYGEMSAGVRDIMAGSRLPVLIDGDDGYGDVKNVVHTVAGYEAMGASAIFIEDQRAPKRCGHMAGKSVIETEAMARKLRAGFDATMKDTQFLEDAQRLRIDISPLPGAKVQEVVEKLYASPKDVVMRARQVIAP